MVCRTPPYSAKSLVSQLALSGVSIEDVQGSNAPLPYCNYQKEHHSIVF